MSTNEYPHQGGDLTVIGPECFTDGSVIAYKGENYTRQPRTIATVEELDALGLMATVLDANGTAWVNDGETEDPWASVAESSIGGPVWTSSPYIPLPATVLHEGEDQK